MSEEFIFKCVMWAILALALVGAWKVVEIAYWMYCNMTIVVRPEAL